MLCDVFSHNSIFLSFSARKKRSKSRRLLSTFASLFLCRMVILYATRMAPFGAPPQFSRRSSRKPYAWACRRPSPSTDCRRLCVRYANPLPKHRQKSDPLIKSFPNLRGGPRFDQYLFKQHIGEGDDLIGQGLAV